MLPPRNCELETRNRDEVPGVLQRGSRNTNASGTRKKFFLFIPKGVFVRHGTSIKSA